MQFIELNDGTVQQVSSELGCAAAKLAKTDGQRMADMLAQSLSTKASFVVSNERRTANLVDSFHGEASGAVRGSHCSASRRG